MSKHTGRPSGYKPEYAEAARAMCERGATDIEIADALEVDVRTIYRWKNQFDDFCQALRSAKDVADNRVERSLFERATGYERDEVDIRVVNGEIVQTPVRKFYPPDTTAAIFWLKNRNPEKWREAKSVEVTGQNGENLFNKIVVEVVKAQD